MYQVAAGRQPLQPFDVVKICGRILYTYIETDRERITDLNGCPAAPAKNETIMIHQTTQYALQKPLVMHR